jgi:Metallo-peptidase family M12B Reprolysin-like/Secretion system C-terminal sorting domain/Bacterial pre-peptidase C-terminal domain/Fibronectin type III domain
MKKVVLLTFALSLFTIMAFSQADRFWSSNNQSLGNIITDKAVARLTYPKVFKLFNLDIDAFRQEVFSIVGQNSTRHSTIITIPNAEGILEQFEIFEASNFEPDLQARFPGIRAYSGHGITDRYATLKLSISPQGIQTMVFRTEKDNEFIEPYSIDHTVYSVYNAHRDKGKLPWTCSTDDKMMDADIHSKIPNITREASGSSTGQLKTMRLAQSCNGEYANFFGATSAAQVGLVLAAFNATLTRCNGCYEKDLALHLNLISNSTSVIYYNPATDPYSTTLSQWNAQLQSTLTSVIGEANYDIGHMFGASGGGGNAGCIGCVCVNGSKGSGITSPADGIPQGDNFDIDYVTHEVGHQLGGNHTFSHSLEGTGVNKEIGSGITIMGYAGITAQDVSNHSIDVYHETTIAQIQANLASKTCPVSVTMTVNHAPVIAAVSNYTIPISTPFELTGSATDPENDPITYSWEQNDNSTTSGTGSVASPTKATGPNWLSFSPTISGTRTFPKLSTILAGLLVTPPLPGGDAGANIEALSSVSRTLNFRLTVRDNNPYVAGVKIGQTAFTDAVVTVSNTSGPFAVTAPNTAVTWSAGSSATITWSVNGTTAAPVSCNAVNILLSTDGGISFPIVLATATANDGTEVITVPSTASNTCRVKVIAVGNIFFDISNTNFTITSAALCGDPAGLTTTAITNTSATLNWSAVANATSYLAEYQVTGGSTWNTIGTTNTTSINLGGLTQGTSYTWHVRATCAAGIGNFVSASFTTTSPCSSPTGLNSSAITSSGATVSWAAVSGATSYAVDYKLNSSGTWTVATALTAATSVNLSGLITASLYDWRVSATCASGTSAFTTAQFTTSAASSCSTAFEPNETQATAAAISSGVTNSAAIGTSTDIDYFKIVTTGNNNMVYNLAGPAGVDFDLYIYNSAGTQIGSGAGSTASETVSLTNQVAGTYFVKVIGYNGANSATCYTITATATPVSTGCISTYDNATNGTTAGAATIPFNTNITGLINPAADVDNYKFVITTAGTITVTLGTLPADYDLKLLNSAGTQVGISQAGGTTGETINYTAAAGTYYAQVYGYNGANNATTCYTLKVQLGTATRTAQEITAANGIVKIYPNPVSNVLNVSVLGGISAKASLQVTDLNGKIVLTQNLINNPQSIDISRLAKGVYLIKVDNGGKEISGKFTKL